MSDQPATNMWSSWRGAALSADDLHSVTATSGAPSPNSTRSTSPADTITTKLENESSTNLAKSFMSDCCLFAKTSVPNQDIVKEFRDLGLDVGTYLVGGSEVGTPSYSEGNYLSGAAFSRSQKEWQVFVNLLHDDLQQSVQNRVRDYQEADLIRKDAIERANTLAQCLRVITKVSESDARQVAKASRRQRSQQDSA